MKHISFTLSLLLLVYVSFSQNLTMDWAKTLEGTGSGWPKSIKQTSSNEYIVVGDFDGPVDFDPTSGINMQSPAGSLDFFFGKYDQNGNLIFLNTIGGTAQDNICQMIIDQNDNIYLLGNFVGTVDFDPSPSTYNLTSYLQQGAFMAKYNSAGGLVYAKSFYSPSPSATLYINDAKTDQNSNLIITGIFNYAVDFDHSANSSLLSNSVVSGFFAKYDPNGDLLFAEQLTGNASPGSAVYKLDIDVTNNIYLIGRFTNDTDFDPSTASVNLNCVGFEDTFFAKYDAQGNLSFAKAINDNADCWPKNIAVDQSGNIYVSCSFMYSPPSPISIDFDPSPASYVYNGASNEYFVASLSKYSNSGNFISVSIFETNSTVYIESILFDADNNMYIGGTLSGTCDFPGTSNTYSSLTPPQDIFIAKYDNAGNFHFCETLQGSNGDLLHSMILDNSQDIVIAGWYDGTFDFDPSSGVFSYNATGTDGFFARYTTSPVGLSNLTSAIPSLYPNPFSDALYLRNLPDNSNVLLTDQLGKEVFSATTSGNERINTTSLPPGCYIVEITSEGKTTRSKMIKY